MLILPSTFNLQFFTFDNQCYSCCLIISFTETQLRQHNRQLQQQQRKQQQLRAPDHCEATRRRGGAPQQQQ